MMNAVFRKAAAAAMFATGLLAVPPAQATVFTATGTTTSGGLPYGATATITPTLGDITVTLTNLNANPTSISQAISGITLNLSNAAGATSLVSSSGTVITIATGGTYVVDSTGTISSSHWGAGPASGGSTITLETQGTYAKSGQPVDLIVGNPNSSTGLYSAGGGSLNAHNDSIMYSATFLISSVGVTASTLISAVSFIFGTSGEVVIANVATTTQIPEPASFALLGAGLLGLGVIRRR